jgi:hypothetical protein
MERSAALCLIQYSEDFVMHSIFKNTSKVKIYDKDVLEEILPLISFSDCDFIVEYGLNYLEDMLIDNGMVNLNSAQNIFLLVESGGLNALLLCCCRAIKPEVYIKCVPIIEKCILDLEALDENQLALITDTFNAGLSLQDSKKHETIRNCINLAQNCCKSSKFCEQFIKTLDQTKLTALFKAGDEIIRQDIIKILNQVLQNSNNVHYIGLGISEAIFRHFSRKIRGETSKLILLLFTKLLMKGSGLF